MGGKSKFSKGKEKDYPGYMVSRTSEEYAFCRTCGKDIKVSAGIKSSIERHESKMHKTTVPAAINDEIVHVPIPSSQSEQGIAVLPSSTPVTLQQPTLDKTLAGNNSLKDLTLYAEAIHAVHLCVHNSSFRSSDAYAGTRKVYQVMFPDSAIARNFTCGRTKASYLAQSIGNYCRAEQMKEIGGSSFAIHVDESTSYVKKRLDQRMLSSTQA